MQPNTGLVLILPCFQSKQITKLQEMSAGDLDTAITTKEKEITEAETNFKVRLFTEFPGAPEAHIGRIAAEGH